MKLRAFVVLGAVVLASLTRVLPHPPNFAPMTAIALFAAATLKDRKLGLLTPLFALLVSDLCIEAMHRFGLMNTWGLYHGMWLTYAITLLIAVMGLALRGRRNVPMIAGMTLAGSVIFFVVSDFGVWAGGGLYPLTWAGLRECYIRAIPYFGNSVAGDAIYSTVLFGGFALAERAIPVLRTTPVLVAPVPEEV